VIYITIRNSHGLGCVQGTGGACAAGETCVAGTGTDTNVHRVFNPTVQGHRFDPGGADNRGSQETAV